MNAASPRHDPRALIGAPYLRGGADPLSGGVDCFGLVVYVRRAYFGLVTPIAGTPRNVQAAIDASTRLRAWHQVPPPGAPGDVATMSTARSRPMHHVGVVLAEGVLHAWCGLSMRGGGVLLTPWRTVRATFPVLEVWTWQS
jgi:cell wall-associated NlpC family hydrolase